MNGTRKLHLKWATAATIMMVVTGSSTYYAGWSAKLRAEGAREAVIQKMLNEHDPLMERVTNNAAQTLLQGQRISTVESAVAKLIDKMDKLTDLMLEDRYQRRTP